LDIFDRDILASTSSRTSLHYYYYYYHQKTNRTMDRRIKVACIGGGQLGRMMALEAPRLNIEMRFLDPNGAPCPAGQVSGSKITQGALTDKEAIQRLIGEEGCDVLTVEIEHVGVEALAELEKEHGINVQPSSRVLGIIRDKLVQKQHFQSKQIPLGPYARTASISEIKEAASALGLPLMLKSRRGGYDGRGNAVLESVTDEAIADALTKLGCDAGSIDKHLDLYAEGWIDFDCEVAVMVVKSANGKDSKTYPAVNAIQQDSICRVVLAPARNISLQARKECESIAQNAIDSLGVGASGMFGVELFVTKSGGILLNEIAPRPHNTGHYTQDACAVSQFENHLRGVCGLPLGSTELICEAAASKLQCFVRSIWSYIHATPLLPAFQHHFCLTMFQLFTKVVNVLGAPSGTVEDTMKSSNAALEMPRAVVHWYGKDGCKPGRKVGHINLTGNSHGELDASLAKLLEYEGIPLSVLPGGCASPLVGVIMGSQSDLPTMHAAVDILKKFGIPYEVDIVSAHRTPDKLVDYARSAAGRGLRVIIAGAGGAAHLPGMVAAMTPLPVVGVPVKTSTLSGVDSLYSIVQMPRGIPVATVAIGNAQNAGLLAARILSTSRVELRQKLMDHQTEMTDMVNGMSAKLQDLGSDEFLAQMDSKNKAVNV
jgi:phosphoribosylaminoimidazole carboxylase